jgi:hypothetical protein
MTPIQIDINKRHKQGMPHHPESVNLFQSIKYIDSYLGENYFCWKSGGDGDNGEILMYQLDIHFERLDAATHVPGQGKKEGPLNS